MRIWCALLAGALLASAQSGVDFSAPPANPKGILALITGSAMRYQGEEPDFTCTELITRNEARAPRQPETEIRWKKRDTLEEVLSFVDGRENHTLILLDGKPTRYTHQSLGGMRSDGLLQFVMVPSWIFGPGAGTDFDWDRWETVAGRRMAVFRFQTPRSIETRPLVDQEEAFMVGYHGLIFADPETGEMSRLEAWMDSPKDFPFQEDSFEIDYGMVQISNEKFLLPVKAMGRVRDGHLLAKNEIEFANYRKYEADVTVTFGDPAQP